MSIRQTASSPHYTLHNVCTDNTPHNHPAISHLMFLVISSNNVLSVDGWSESLPPTRKRSGWTWLVTLRILVYTINNCILLSVSACRHYVIEVESIENNFLNNRLLLTFLVYEIKLRKSNQSYEGLSIPSTAHVR